MDTLLYPFSNYCIFSRYTITPPKLPEFFYIPKYKKDMMGLTVLAVIY